MRKITVGVLASVDAGKTTLSEAVLFLSGALRRLGRVDHADSFLDTDEQERRRGITIYSKEASFLWNDCRFVLLDTPGHVDLASEAERVLPVLDCAVLLVSATDGVRAHTETLWRLLEHYGVPTFLFINKMDLPGAEKNVCLEALRSALSPQILDFSDENWMEQAAAESEEALEEFLSLENLRAETVRPLIERRAVFPCLFGAALRTEGVRELLDALAAYAPEKKPLDHFCARVFKITRDSQEARLTWLRVLGGTLSAKQSLSGVSREGETWEEKIHQIRAYSGEKYVLCDTALPGDICAVTGLTHTGAGEILGEYEGGKTSSVLESVFSYRVLLQNADPFTVLQKLRLLEEEDPQLHVVWEEEAREIKVRLMGPMQLDILRERLLGRFGLQVDFDEGSILYKETIAAPVEGVGHYEPLRHYAEVHLLLSPLPRGSGLEFVSECPTDELDLNWQRLILTHLSEKTHRGVLTGSPITDMRIAVASGRAHPKHTEGGDFRQATYRAVRQGLMSAESVLLEPWYSVELRAPNVLVGRAITDLQHMGGRFDTPVSEGAESVLRGAAPAAGIKDYQQTLTAYTRGAGKLFLSFLDYEPCADPQTAIAASGYDPARDTANTPDSVFCAHGAGFVVKWNEVPEHMHLESCLKKKSSEVPAAAKAPAPAPGGDLDKELQKIFERTYGPVKNRGFIPASEREARQYRPKAAPLPAGPEYLLVDGYNIIYAWDDLKAVAADNLDAARQILMDLMSNFQALRGCELILVFDAYRVPFHTEEVVRYHNIHVVYTKEAETADAYIEKAAHELAARHRVRVATSDGIEQLIILNQGALRVSASAFRTEVEQAGEELRRILRQLARPDPARPVAAALRRAAEMDGPTV